MKTKLIKKIKTAPKNPGIYIFYKNRIPLYVGKASNLRNRLQSYLPSTPHPSETGTDTQTRNWSPKSEGLRRDANGLKLIKLRSNIEALIVESKLIKELKPRYNVLWRDDTSYFYVYFTKEIFPKIYIGHNSSFIIPNSEQIGPFTDGQSLKTTLRLLRRYFPYCTCKPHFRLCLNAQINNCPGYCCNKNAKPTKNQNAQYKKNVRRIKNILTGKDKKFIKKLKDPYELLVLEKIWAHKPFLANSQWQMANGKNKDAISYKLSAISRAECYDISHLSGKEAVGAMTAWRKRARPEFIRGEARPNYIWAADKNLWRQFKIRGRYTQDDPRMLKEVLTRRLRHPEWTYPDLIIIDGGLTQLNAAKQALKTLHPKPPTLNPKIISFAKPQKLVLGLKNKPVPISGLPKNWQILIDMAINQTHNFVRRYHRRVRQKQFLDI